MNSIFNVSHRKVGGLHFVRIGRLGFSWYITSKPVHKEPRTHNATLDDVKYHREYPGGSTVVVYHDR